MDRAQKLQVLTRVQQLRKYLWLCPDPRCDGRPHGLYPSHARPEQRPPDDDWWTWMLMSGRGAGKTRSGAEYVKARALAEPNHRTAIITPDFGHGRDVCIEGESGLHGLLPGQGVIPKNRIKTWNRSIGELTLTNGSWFKLFGTNTRKDAESLRGYQFHTAWFDELATCPYGDIAWSMLEFALRLGDDPKIVVTTTPRPVPIIKKLVKDSEVHVTRGTTYDNRANLPARLLKRLRDRYEGTNLGKQELMGELLADSVGAVWKYDDIQRVHDIPSDLDRIVVAIDPAGTAHTSSDETGIVVAGRVARTAYIIEDVSGRYSPEEWSSLALSKYQQWNADAIVAEVNFGADMVKAMFRNSIPRPNVREVRAGRGQSKQERAIPVHALYQQGKVFHVGSWADLEVQMTTWVPPNQIDDDGEEIPKTKTSPDRMDAMVWAVHDLLLKPTRRQTGMTAQRVV